MMRPFLFFSIGALAFASPAFAADTEKVDQAIQKLFLSDVVYTRDRHELQIAGSPSLMFHEDDAHLRLRLPLSLQLGLTDRFQIDLEAAGEVLQMQGGDTVTTGTLQLGGLGCFFSDKERRIALSSGLKLLFPPVTQLTEPRVYAYEPHFIAYTSSGRWHLNLQAGGVIAHRVDERGIVQGHAKVSLGGFVTAGAFAFTFEFVIETVPATYRLAPGALWHPTEWMEFGVGLPLSIVAQQVARRFEEGVIGRIVLKHDLGAGNPAPPGAHPH